MVFNAIEAAAYNGEWVDLDNMDPVEYKYFSRIAKLGTDWRAGKYGSASEVATIRNGYFAQYQSEREQQDKLEAYNSAWVECIRTTESLRVHINGESDPMKIAALACRAIYIMTNDTFILDKAHEMEEKQ